jgi:hypothetical protein
MRDNTALRGVTIGLAALLLLVPAVTGWAVDVRQEPTPPDSSGDLPDQMVVEAENQVRQDIHKSVFHLPLSAAVIDTYVTEMDDLVLQISPVAGLQPFLNNPVHLASEQVPHCWLPDPATTPVVTFYPENPRRTKVRSWELAVTDYRGDVFKTFRGKGKPPRKIPWDGRGEDGQMLQVGYPYSYVFTIVDEGTNTYNYAGVSFRIPAVDYLEGDERRLDITGDDVFAKERARLAEHGSDWLIRAADQIRQDHPRSPLKVVVQAETEELASRRAELVAKELTEAMILPGDWIKTEAQARPDLRAEMDGRVSIRIEHARRGG